MKLAKLDTESELSGVAPWLKKREPEDEDEAAEDAASPT